MGIGHLIVIDGDVFEDNNLNRQALCWESSLGQSKAKAAREIPSLSPGDRVVHDSFGMGTVVSLEGMAEKSVASVDFGSQGVKRLLLRYAPLEKL